MRYYFWYFVHNCIAHPLLVFGLDSFHDWSADKLQPGEPGLPVYQNPPPPPEPLDPPEPLTFEQYCAQVLPIGLTRMEYAQAVTFSPRATPGRNHGYAMELLNQQFHFGTDKKAF